MYLFCCLMQHYCTSFVVVRVGQYWRMLNGLPAVAIGGQIYCTSIILWNLMSRYILNTKNTCTLLQFVIKNYSISSAFWNTVHAACLVFGSRFPIGHLWNNYSVDHMEIYQMDKTHFCSSFCHFIRNSGRYYVSKSIWRNIYGYTRVSHTNN